MQIPKDADLSSFEIRDILSSPYPENLVAGFNSFAWTFNDQGVRNIWVASGPQFSPVQLTGYDKDDGIKLSGLTFSPDGTVLFYVRGGLGQEQESAIWAISAAGGTSSKLAVGNSPVVSPDKNRGVSVLFSSQGQICQTLFDSDNRDVVVVENPLFKLMGTNKTPVWSPDGQSILFVSDRDTHSLIGVYSFKKKAIKWMMPGVDRDVSPVWSPDGKQISFVHIPGKTTHEQFDLTAEFEISIWVVDIESGRGDKIWSSPETGGWAEWYPLYATWYSSALRWTRNNRILFYSEHEGRLHIYSMLPSGEDIRDLTPGNSQVWGSAVSSDGGRLYYCANSQDPDCRHIWQTQTTGGTPVRVTDGDYIDTDPVLSGNGASIAFRRATAVQPQTVTVKKILADTTLCISHKSMPERFPSDLIVPEKVCFPSDNFQIHCQLFMPENARPKGKLPALIFVHGGPFRQMLPGWGHYASYAKTYALNQYFTSRGYLVLSVNYRSGTGYGRTFRQAENQGPRGASEYADILAAHRYLASLPEVDSRKIGIWGNSCGGYLTCLALARNSDLFAAGVSLAGIYDFALRATHMSEPGGEWGIQGENSLTLAYNSSPIADIEKWKSPVLLVHGDDDRSVIFAQTINLVQRLREQGVDMELLVFPGESHDFALHKSWIRIFDSALNFFDRTLKS